MNTYVLALKVIAGYNKDMSLISHLGRWMIVEVPTGLLRTTRNLYRYILEMFGVRAHVAMFWTPMFHDKTFVGYLLTLVFRVIFIVCGYLVALIVSSAIWLALGWWLLGWTLWVVMWEVGLVWMVMVAGLFVWRVKNGKAWRAVRGAYTWSKLIQASDRNIARLMKQYPDLSSWWEDREAQWWLLRMGLWSNELPKTAAADRNEWGAQIWKMVGATEVRVHSGHLLLALAQVDSGWREFMRKMYVETKDMERVVEWQAREMEWWQKYPLWDEKFSLGEMAGFNRGMTGVRTRILDQYSVDLTEKADSLAESIGKEDKYVELFGVLARSRGENIMLLGENGVGKSTFVGGIARMIMRGNAPEMVRNKRLVKLEVGRLMAGTYTQGDAAGRLVKLMDDIKRSSDIILFIDDIHTLMTPEAMQSGMNLFSVIQEAVVNTKIQLIGATTVKNFKRFIEPMESFAGMFSSMNMEEPDDEQAVLILENLIHDLELAHGVVYSYQALRDAVVLSRRYMPEGVLPDKAKSILDEAGARAKMQKSYYVNGELIAQLVGAKSGIPVHRVDMDEKNKLLVLEEEIHKAFVGQETAVESVADALRRARLDVRSNARPIGTFLFVGPTGVGKTELSRQLARVYYGSEAAMIRFDMTEFSQIHMINRLIGAPVGTSGSEQGGELTEKVRRSPFSLILLDELEKAHPKVWDLLLQVMEDGRLTDASGLTVDFSHTILIATSNAVTSFIQERLEQGQALDELKGEIVKELAKTFRLEFINRFDGIVPFAPLELEQLKQVVRLEMEKLANRLSTREVKLSWTEEVVDLIGRRAEVEHLGARPIRRFLQDIVESRVAKKMLMVDEVRGMEIVVDEAFIS